VTAPIAVSCGDPSGIGPEIVCATWHELRANVPFAWIGDPRHLPKGFAWQAISTIGEATKVSETALPVLPQEFAADAIPGKPDPDNASGTVAAIERAVSLAMAGEASAICTAPIHKKALIDGAGFCFPGHTEFLAHLAGVDRVVMLLASEKLKVVPATIHVALAKVPNALTEEALEQTLRITNDGMKRWFGIEHPRIAVAGLNPHAGEGGAMGQEEIDVIEPVLERLRTEGFILAGPQSADTMFHEKARASYDVAVAMYHDQALIPIKTLDFDSGVNMTLGLPFIRTSPDHGTAYDIAGKGLARPESLMSALKLAWRLAEKRDCRK
jgi:4-hydroxythreonine-4-phosphate dehydrogenase